MKATGSGKICLFQIQSDIDRELSRLAAKRIAEKMGFEIKEKKIIQKFDIPLVPAAEDFFMFPFRHISATIVAGGTWRATDFSKEGVLKKSKGKLIGKPAYLNHNQEVGKEVGVVGDTEWVDSYKHESGLTVPPGIEAPFIIDGKLYGDLVRKLSSPISPIQSASVTLVFEWEASHDFEHEGDFFYHLGEEIDGEMVRRIAINIKDYEESSMVWMGADPYAKMLDDKGEIINIDRAAAFAKHKFADDPDNQKYESWRKFYVFDCLDNQKLLHLSKSFKEPGNPEPQKNIITMDKELLKLLAEFFGTTEEKITNGQFKKADVAEKFVVKPQAEFAKLKSAEDFQKEIDAKTVLQTKVTGLEAEVSTLKTEKANLETEKTTLTAKAGVADKILKAAKDEAKRVYGLFSKNKPEKVITDELESETDIDKLNKKIELFGGQAVTQFGGYCASCKGTEIKFRRSVNIDTPPDPPSEEKYVPMAERALSR